jgi:hypothetical protein
MPRGGARPGAGRKRGGSNVAAKRREEALRKAEAAGLTPLDVMLQAMRDAFAKGGPVAAHAYAKDAAPFVHPRLAAMMAKISTSGNPWVEILALIDGEDRGLPEKPVLKLVDGTGRGAPQKPPSGRSKASA